MKEKPIHIALFLIVVLIVLFGLMFLSQKGAVVKAQSKDDGFAYGELSLKYPTLETFLSMRKDSSLTREDIIKVAQIVAPLDIEEEELPEEEIEDSDKELKKDIAITELPDFSKIDTTQLERIRYPQDNPNFVAELRTKLSSADCRIVHYGDSQIEGDRITGYLRNRLQKMYGGSGPGFIPVKPVYNQISAIVEPSDNWERFAFFDPTKKKFVHRKYGVYMSISRFTKYQKQPYDSIALDTMPVVKATIKIGKSKKTYLKFRKFSTIGLHYGNCRYPIKISVFNDGKLIKEDSLNTNGKYHNYKIKTPITPKNLVIELEGKVSADFYGLTLDGGAKVQIDNVAMRGASGLIYTGSSGSTYGRMVRELGPKFVIMQYGGNMMPYLKDSTDVDRYAKQMVNQVNWIRRRAKETSVLFIGPTDMCAPVNGKMETYPLLPYLNEKLMQTSLENNIAYWSMYHAMGGKGAMTLWVDEKMASRDYMHFTWKGTKIISELFFTALYLDLKQPDPNDV